MKVILLFWSKNGDFYQGDRVSLISGGDCERDVIARGGRVCLIEALCDL